MTFTNYTFQALSSIQECLLTALYFKHKKATALHLVLTIVREDPAAVYTYIDIDKSKEFVELLEATLSEKSTLEAVVEEGHQLLSYELVEIINEAEKYAKKDNTKVTNEVLVKTAFSKNDELQKLAKRFRKPSNQGNPNKVA